MGFLIDVNASRTLGNILIVQGYDVAFVSEIDPEMPDEEILKWAVKEKRIIITTDKDFEQLIWQQNKAHCGILRLENLPRQQRIQLLEEVLQSYRQDLEKGAIIIATQAKFRIRRS
ncbi:MAG: DUF5615 family PIN-like protein [Microcystaceae cyanobacterium]